MVKLTSQSSELVKILREVTLLAKLSHPNIVSYKAAWLEPLLENPRNMPNNSEDSSSEPSVPNNSFSESSSFSLKDGGVRKVATIETITEVDEDAWAKNLERVVGVAASPPAPSVHKNKS